MWDTWECPNGHCNGFRVIENSPDINCILSEDAPCEECGIEFDPKIWKSHGIEYDEGD